MNENENTLKSSLIIWKKIFSYVQGSKIIYTLVFIMYSLMGTIFSLNTGLLLKNITKGTIEGNTQLVLTGAIIFASISILSSAVAWLVGHIFVSRTKMKAEYQLKLDLFYHILNRPIPREADAHTGDSLARLVNDSDSVVNALTWDTLGIIWPLGSLLSCGIITLIINWKIGIVTLLIGVLFLLFTNKVATPMRKNNKLVKEASSKATQRLLDYLSAAPTVKIMGIEISLLGRFEKATDEVQKMTMKNIVLNAWYSTLGSAIGIITTVIVLGLGVFFVSRGEMALENVMFIYQFAASAVYGLVSIGRSLTRFQNVAASANRVFELFDSPSENKRVNMPSIAKQRIINQPTIKITNMTFSYQDEREAALNNVSMIINKGEHIALVGESGSGKSTFFKLLLGLYEPDEGDILIEGVNTKEVSLKSVREYFSYVSQDSPLFDGSIKDNIRMGKKDATDTEIIQTAIKANTNGFIMEFPNGYDSEVGELGAQISGGQKQRVAITRAILHNAPVLLLDEATSSLDSYNEKQIQEALNEFSKDKTTIVAAHRLSTVKESDMIYVFSKGEIIEVGKHDQLMNAKGTYAKLVEAGELNNN